jgi:hypothetical protein
VKPPHAGQPIQPGLRVARRERNFAKPILDNFMNLVHYAITLALFACLLIWLGWRERANNNSRDGGMLFLSGGVTGVLGLVVALIE